jgi:hypothetical protein
MTEKKPRKHNPKWKDTTVTKRQSKRREQLNQIAVSAGWQSWSVYETAIINGETRLTPLAPDSGYAPAKKAKSKKKVGSV